MKNINVPIPEELKIRLNNVCSINGLHKKKFVENAIRAAIEDEENIQKTGVSLLDRQAF